MTHAIPGLIIVPFTLFGLLIFAFWIWALVDCIKNNRLSDTEKIVWVLVIILLNALGGLIYLLAGRNK